MHQLQTALQSEIKVLWISRYDFWKVQIILHNFYFVLFFLYDFSLDFRASNVSANFFLKKSRFLWKNRFSQKKKFSNFFKKNFFFDFFQKKKNFFRFFSKKKFLIFCGEKSQKKFFFLKKSRNFFLRTHQIFP